MKNVKLILAGCYILIPVFLFLSMAGCEGEYYVRGEREYNRGYRHHYREGRWYRQESPGHDIAVAALAIGEIIDALPPIHTTVVVGRTPYYHDGRYYYRRHPRGGYMVVAPPVEYERNYEQRRE